MMMNQLNAEKTSWKLGLNQMMICLDKTFNISDMTTVAASVLEKNGKYYPQTFFHECTYNL